MKNDNEDISVEEISDEELDKIKDKIVHSPEDMKFKFYTEFRDRLRKKIKKSLGKNAGKNFEYLFLLPDFFMLFVRMLFDDRVKKSHKLFVGSIITYVILPIDLIPDFIPIVGYIDDLAIVVFGLDYLLKNIDNQIILDNWSGEADLLKSVKNIIGFLSEFLNRNIVEKIKLLLETFKRK